MMRCPRTRGELRQWIRRQRKRGVKYRHLATMLQAAFVPTSWGLRSWIKGAVHQHERKVGSDDHIALRMTENVLGPWRSHLIGLLLGSLCPGEPAFAMRYGAQVRQDTGRWIIQLTEPAPVGICDLVERTLRDTDWLGREGVDWGLQ